MAYTFASYTGAIGDLRKMNFGQQNPSADAKEVDKALQEFKDKVIRLHKLKDDHRYVIDKEISALEASLADLKKLRARNVTDIKDGALQKAESTYPQQVWGISTAAMRSIILDNDEVARFVFLQVLIKAIKNVDDEVERTRKFLGIQTTGGAAKKPVAAKKPAAKKPAAKKPAAKKPAAKKPVSKKP